MHLVKAHGLGNDFLIADLRGGEPAPSPLDPDAARRLCDRRRGIGADGVIAVLPPSRPDAHARMRVRNADGSEPELCGNGIRCLAALLHARGAPTALRIETAAGVIACAVARAPGGGAEVEVEMGTPRIDLAPGAPPGGGPGAREFAVTRVVLGNPHAVVFADGDVHALAREHGPALERDPRFPDRTNVEFARIAGDAIEVGVWERGVGITQACGTGACAAAAAAVATGRAPAGRPLDIRLPGGTLRVTVAPGLAGVRMRGPAVQVCEVEVDLARLLEDGAATPRRRPGRSRPAR